MHQLDVLFEWLYYHMHYVYALGIIIIVIKLIGTFLWKGFNFTALIGGFIRFYSYDEIDMSDPHDRYLYRRWNNIWNIVFYVWLLVFVIVKFASLHAG
jgi:hypothetical protein